MPTWEEGMLLTILDRILADHHLFHSPTCAQRSENSCQFLCPISIAISLSHCVPSPCSERIGSPALTSLPFGRALQSS